MGQLRGRPGPSFEYPWGVVKDGKKTNEYQGVVTVSDGTLTAEQAITVNVTNRDLGPFISMESVQTVRENTTFVGTTFAEKESTRPNSTLTYSLFDRGDNLYFLINGSNGRFEFKQAPDFEKPSDSNQDNVYELSVAVRDEKLIYHYKNFRVLVIDVWNQ